jgi:hypothetical protein
MKPTYANMDTQATLYDIEECKDCRIDLGEKCFETLQPLRSFRGNYGVPRKDGTTVVKGFFSSTELEMRVLEDLHSAYVAELSKHIPVLPTEICRTGSSFFLKQRYIPSQTFERFLPGDALDVEKRRAYGVILDQTIRTLRNSTKKIGIDCKPENWMAIDGQWTLIDTFPPLYSDENIRFGDVFYKRSFERQFADRPERSYFRDLSKVARRFLLKSEKLTDIDLQEETYSIMGREAPETLPVLNRLRGSE